MAEEGLRNKTLKGVGWSAIDNVASYAISFIIGILLARLLEPEDYGLVGLTGIFMVLCYALIDGGLGSALIRKKDATDDDYNTVFITNLVMSILMYATIFVCAPWIADFFERQELIALVRVQSLAMIIGALSFVQRIKITKKIDFKTITKISVFASIISGITGVTMAFLGCGVWALVFHSLSSQIIKTLCYWFVNKWIPTLKFCKESFKELFGFGWKMMLSGILNSFWGELYKLIVGKVYSPGALGQYTRACSFSELFSSNITGVVQRVTYPVLSSIQDDKTRMVEGYRKIIKLTMFATAICMLSLGAISEPLIYCLIGEKWHDAAMYLPVICLTMSLYPLHAINLNMLQVQGRSDLFLGLEIVKKIIGLGPLLIGAFVGILPMLWTGVATGIICFFLNSYYTGKLLNYSSWKQIMDVAPSYLIGVVIFGAVWFFKYLPISYWVILPIQLIVGIVVFFVVCELTKREEYIEIKGIALNAIKKIKH